MSPFVCLSIHSHAVDLKPAVAEVSYLYGSRMAVAIAIGWFIFPATSVEPRGRMQDKFRLGVSDFRRVAFDRRHDYTDQPIVGFELQPRLQGIVAPYVLGKRLVESLKGLWGDRIGPGTFSLRFGGKRIRNQLV